MKELTLALLLMLAPGLRSSGQQTVGLFQYDDGSFEGYTLFTPMSYNFTYLIDNCGLQVQSWESSYAPGMSVYLLETGELLRTGRTPSEVFKGAGGRGGIIERYDWNGGLNWSYLYASDQFHQHHDIEPLPNGNFLLVAWEYRSRAEAIAHGRNPNTIGNDLWPERIVEIEPVGSNQANIVWSWYLWDHLVQDFDSSQLNYGVVADHPELIDINHTNSTGFGGHGADWIHINGIDYNESLDQIAISSLYFNEVWIIDHSTTPAEASGHTGGNYGKGGDLLYRYGNPAAYGRGTDADRVFTAQHNATWIPEGSPHEGKLMVFNNRALPDQSSIDIIAPPQSIPGYYLQPDDQPYGPPTVDWSYTEPGFYSANISGATSLPNGNILICEGQSGTVFEIRMDGGSVWTYINPVNMDGPVVQGNWQGSNALFRAERYAADFPGLLGKELTGVQPVEQDPYEPPSDLCTDNDSVPDPSPAFPSTVAFANPVRGVFELDVRGLGYSKAELFALDGRSMWGTLLEGGHVFLDVTEFSSGIYILRLSSSFNLADDFKLVIQ